MCLSVSSSGLISVHRCFGLLVAFIASRRNISSISVAKVHSVKSLLSFTFSNVHSYIGLPQIGKMFLFLSLFELALAGKIHKIFFLDFTCVFLLKLYHI